MIQAFLVPSGLTAATAPAPGKRIGKFDFKLVNCNKAKELVEKVPEDIWCTSAYVMAALVEIGYGFIETVQEIGKEIRCDGGKYISREIRSVIANRDSLERTTAKWRKFIGASADWLYNQFADDFERLYNTLYNDLSRLMKDDNARRLMIAVFQAVCVGEIAQRYGQYLCEIYAKYGASYTPLRIYGPHYDTCVRLASVYGCTVTGDEEFRCPRARNTVELTAGIISKRLADDMYGKGIWEIFQKHFPDARPL